MYLDYFGFKKAPFKITPDTETFYAGGDRGAIFRAISYSILNGDAITKVIGEVGSGKTMLCRMLETQLPEHIDIIYLANPRLSPDDALQAIAYELNITIAESEISSRIMVLKALHHYLLEAHSKRRQVVVFIEEAQSMPLETLEEIRMLGNLETHNSKLFQIVLFGQPELDDNLRQNHIRQIRDRITCSFYLSRFNQNEISDYLLFKLYSSGYRGPHLFSNAAIRLIKNASKGLLRRINILADKSLLACYSDSRRIVSYLHVKKAIKDTTAPRTRLFNLAAGWAAPVFSFLLVVTLGIGTLEFSSLGKNTTEFDVNQLPPSSAGKSTQNLNLTPLIQGLQTIFENQGDIQKQKKKPKSFIDLRKSKTHAWLKNVNSNNFTIQVLLTDADSVSGLERFLRQKEMAEVLGTIYVYDANIRGTLMIGVLYGDFKNYSDALNALNKLPAPLRRYQPFIRNIRDVIAEKQSENNGHTRDST